MLISFLALIALVNAILGWLGGWSHAGPQPAADLRLGVRAGRLEPGRAVERRADVVGNLLGTRMVLNEFVAFSQLGPMKAHARSEVVHDRDVRAVRVRQLQLDRHPDRRHRRAGARPPARSGPARPARDARRHAGQLHDGDASRRSCSRSTIMALTYRRQIDAGGRVRCAAQSGDGAATSRSCSARGSAISRTRLTGARDDAVRRASALAGVAGRRPRRASSSSGTLAARRRVLALSGRVPLLRRTRSRHGDVRDARARPARREDADPHQRGRRHQHAASRRAR